MNESTQLKFHGTSSRNFRVISIMIYFNNICSRISNLVSFFIKLDLVLLKRRFLQSTEVFYKFFKDLFPTQKKFLSTKCTQILLHNYLHNFLKQISNLGAFFIERELFSKKTKKV